MTDPGPEDTDLLRPGEVARLLRVDPSTIRRYADLGRLTPVRTPTGQRRYRGAEVRALMAADMPGGELITTGYLAVMCRVNAKTAARWAKSGKLTSVRTLGGHRRYLEAEVRALLATAPEAPPDPPKAPVRSLWPVNITGPSAVVLGRLQSIGLSAVGALTCLTAAELRSVGLSADQVDEVRLVLYRKGLALAGDVLGDVA